MEKDNKRADLVVEGSLVVVDVSLLLLALQPLLGPIRGEMLAISGMLSVVSIAAILELAKQRENESNGIHHE